MDINTILGRKKRRLLNITDSEKKRRQNVTNRARLARYRERCTMIFITKTDKDRLDLLKKKDKTKKFTTVAFLSHILDVYEKSTAKQPVSKRRVEFSSDETVPAVKRSTPAKPDMSTCMSNAPLPPQLSDISSIYKASSSKDTESSFCSKDTYIGANNSQSRLHVSYDLDGIEKEECSDEDSSYDVTYAPGEKSMCEYREEQSYLADPTFDPYALFDNMTVQERQLINEKDYEEMDMMEEVFPLGETAGEDEAESDDDEDLPSSDRVNDPDDLVGKKFSYVMDENLLSLAKMRKVTSCSIVECKRNVRATLKHRGTSVNIEWVCESGHVTQKWKGQPILRRVNGGDFLLAASILTSGNNYAKIKHMFDIMGAGCVSHSTYYNIQANYLIPSISKYWEDMQQETLNSLIGKEVIILGDGRMDSPGHSAKYCTYTVFDEATKDILAVMVVDKRECDLKSTNMELKAFRNALDLLLDKGVIVKEVVTDAHVQVAKLLREHYPHIKHSFDVWHGSKNLSKKVGVAGAEKGNEALLLWNKDIINHFWHCAETCNMDKDLYLVKWAGMLHHVTNKHEWLLGHGSGPAKCDHKPLTDEERDKPWIEPYSKPHNKLRRIILDTRLINNIPKYVNYRHTGNLESFQNHILMYAGKRFAFSYDAYRARCLLAAIDHSKHKDREYKMKTVNTEDGQQVLVKQYKRMFSKKTKIWYTVPVKEQKVYSYIPYLHKQMVQLRLDDRLPMSRRAAKPAGHPDTIAPTIAPLPPPPTSDLVKRHETRFHKQD